MRTEEDKPRMGFGNINRPLKRLSLPISILCILSVAIGSTTSGSTNGTEQLCGVDQAKPPQRLFATSDGKSEWHEYQNMKDVPVIELDSGAFACLWMGSKGSEVVHMQVPSEDFASYTDYCFDKKGELTHVRYELRTAWEWGFREEGPIKNSVLGTHTSEFFDTKNEKAIVKPQNADDIAGALTPRLYLRKSQLPFSKLLTK
jgi:hypothetical protein